MILPSPPVGYDRADQAQMRDAVRRADNENHKRGRDLELGSARLILTDAATGERYVLSVAGGVLDLDLL
jgi:hypothetical protein